nr:MAG TPA: hypothetical protein [Crassvirales sp.]
MVLYVCQSIVMTDRYMKRRVVEEVIKNVNIVKCDGAICVSVNSNDRRYYAQGVSSRMLDVKRYKV